MPEMSYIVGRTISGQLMIEKVVSVGLARSILHNFFDAHTHIHTYTHEDTFFSVDVKVYQYTSVLSICK